MPFLLLLTPLYINTHHYVLCLGLIICAVVWPTWSQGEGAGWGMGEGEGGDLGVRLMLVCNAVYMMASSGRVEKFRVLPSVVANEGLPILI